MISESALCSKTAKLPLQCNTSLPVSSNCQTLVGRRRLIIKCSRRPARVRQPLKRSKILCAVLKNPCRLWYNFYVLHSNTRQASPTMFSAYEQLSETGYVTPCYLHAIQPRNPSRPIVRNINFRNPSRPSHYERCSDTDFAPRVIIKGFAAISESALCSKQGANRFGVDSAFSIRFSSRERNNFQDSSVLCN